jgi:hypothetical protein
MEWSKRFYNKFNVGNRHDWISHELVFCHEIFPPACNDLIDQEFRSKTNEHQNDQHQVK